MFRKVDILTSVFRLQGRLTRLIIMESRLLFPIKNFASKRIVIDNKNSVLFREIIAENRSVKKKIVLTIKKISKSFC